MEIKALDGVNVINTPSRRITWELKYDYNLLLRFASEDISGASSYSYDTYWMLQKKYCQYESKSMPQADIKSIFFEMPTSSVTWM